MAGLLDGIRVLEVAVLFNGDLVGQHLGDLGADVIKVEAPGRGDYLRDMLGQIVPHHSPAHLQVNRNKRSITLDPRTEAGREVFWQLHATADVFVDGLIAGSCDRLGIGYDEQRRRKPDIVYCHCSGFGATGEYAAIPTHGQMMNAAAGAVTVGMDDDGFVRHRANDELMSGTTGGGDGTSSAAVHAALRTAAALVRRGRTGEGAFLDAAGADAVIAQGWIGAVYGWNEQRLTDRRGLRPPGSPAFSSARYQYYETNDRRFVLFCAIETKFWARFCEAVGRPDLVGAASPDGAPVDFAHGDHELRRTLQEIFSARSQREWIALAIANDLPLGPAHQTVGELRSDPHLAARSIIVDGEHPVAGPFSYVGSPVIVDHEPFAVRRPAPELGQHTAEVLAEFGIDDRRLAELRAAGAI
ncbi:MAG: CoA transferase [Actinobacteria bacterium]|nr:CoA transferase [Actinomycetota bacterium]